MPDLSSPRDRNAHPPEREDAIAPAPENFPSYRRPSQKQGPSFSDPSVQQAAAQAFVHGAEVYQDVRPGYPSEVTELVSGLTRVVDIGAGTGKLTKKLSNPLVLALDPSPDMCRVLANQLDVPVWRATAEATGLAENSVDAATCAQSWHWVDSAAASAEMDRIVRPDGRVLLVWNTLDVLADPWILRLSRIMHSGDVHKEGFYPQISPPWKLERELRLKWEDKLNPEQIHSLMHTRSYWLKANERTRLRMTHNLNWYLFEHMGFTPNQPLSLPYRTDAFLFGR